MAYTAEEVDAIIKSLEQNTERQIATVGSHVKGVAAERDLLKSAEAARDLLVRAVAGEKEFLDSVFGGSCERIGRLHLPLNRVTFSEMHANDLRWENLRSSVETVEAVLKDLGTFKPWVPPAAKPPELIVFRGTRRRLSPGRRVNLRLQVEGGEPAEFTVEPALPAGLELSKETGSISGVIAADTEIGETTYVVTASNAAGEAQTELTFAVAEPPPTALSYPDRSEDLLVGEEVRWQPQVERGGAAQWSVTPAFPAGLELDASSGTISGAAQAAADEADYEVEASFTGGRVAVTLRLAVRHGPPPPPSYASACGEGPLELELAGAPVELVPDARGDDVEPVSYEVVPDLPRGLAIDPSTGVIAGVPEELATQTPYTITARNANGKSSCELLLSVVLKPPKELSYPSLEQVYRTECEVALKPKVEGTVDSFTVSPALPPSLQLDASSGEIAGTPLEPVPETTYEVTAHNAAGTLSATLAFAIKLPAPTSLGYPSVEGSYELGKELSLEADLSGRDATFSVHPPLPDGLALDPATGAISGTPVAEAAEASYEVTAANAEGKTTASLCFAIVAPPPAELAYPGLRESYAVGDEVDEKPEVMSKGGTLTYTVTPDLPAGLQLDAKSGAISGVVAAVTEQASYTVSVANGSGKCSAELVFEVAEAIQSEAVADTISGAFAAQVEATTDLSELCAEPSRAKAFGDWMVWMVHRVYLNDPTLVTLDFSNMHMPPPHVEERIAPKLMKSLAANTHLEVLRISNTNLMRPQGAQLAESLKENATLLELNVETNFLDSEVVREIAVAIANNDNCKLEQVRLGHQRSGEFGLPAEEAVGLMMQKRQTIHKLGFHAKDSHWRNIIDRAVVRNNDMVRRMRNRNGTEEEELKAEDKALSRIFLCRPPQKAVSEFFPEDRGNSVYRSFVAEQKRLPTSSQLQSYAKNSGEPLKYSLVALLIKECRARILDAAVGTAVEVADSWMVTAPGQLRAWNLAGSNWELDVLSEDSTRRFNYTSSTEPAILVGDDWAAWLREGGPGS